MKSRRSGPHEIRREPSEGAFAHRAEQTLRERALVRERVHALPNVRQELVAALREEVREGRYMSDSRVIAGAMLEESALLRRALPMVLEESCGGLPTLGALVEIYEAQARLFGELRELVTRQRRALLEDSAGLSESLDREGRALSERFNALERERSALEEGLEEPLDARAHAARRAAGEALQALLSESAVARVERDGDES